MLVVRAGVRCSPKGLTCRGLGPVSPPKLDHFSLFKLNIMTRRSPAVSRKKEDAPTRYFLLPNGNLS
jgi:hypothetical protein